MEIIRVDNIKHNYESNLKQFLTDGGINFDDLILRQYNSCCELFDRNFGPQKGELINTDHTVTFSSDDWKKALSLLPGGQRNHILWLTSVIREDHQVVKALKFQQSGDFCFLLIRNCGDHVALVPIYLSFKKKTIGISWNQSQFNVNYQEKVYLLNDAITKELFPQSEANQDQACGTPMAAPCDQNMHQFQSQGRSIGAVTQSQRYNSGYMVNYKDGAEFMHGKRITDIVEHALRVMDVPQGRITSRRVYDQIIDNMSSKLGNPTPHLATYENIQESQSIVPSDLKSLLPKSNLLTLLFGSDNQVDTRRGQEMTREEVMLTASKEGQCLDIGVVYLKVDVETEIVKHLLKNSSKEKKTLQYKKMTFSMSSNKVQSIASQLN